MVSTIGRHAPLLFNNTTKTQDLHGNRIGKQYQFARRAITDFSLSSKIVSIDPSPRAAIDKICDEPIRRPLESVSLDTFDALNAGDILFVDNSHVGLQGSDVTIFFTEVLPRLRPGVIWGLHDIYLPNDYPDEWKSRHYNEQYFLMVYLLGGARRDSIQFPAAYLVEKKMTTALRAALSKSWAEEIGDGWLDGGVFWMQRVS